MSPFISDLFVAIIGGFLGAGLGAGAAILIASRERKQELSRRTVATVNALISNMSVRRSLSIELQTSDRPHLNRELDQNRTVEAVLAVRTLTQAARDAITAPQTADELGVMISYCNDYLELQEGDREGNGRLLAMLSARLNECVIRLSAGELSGIRDTAPGSASRKSILPAAATAI